MAGQALWQLVADSSDAVLIVNAQTGEIVWENQAFLQWFGVSADVLEGALLDELLPEFSVGSVRDLLTAVAQNGLQACVPIRLPGNSELRNVPVSLLRLGGDGDCLVAVVAKFPHLAGTTRDWPSSSRFDPLTGLPDRALLLAELDARLGGDRFSDRQFALLFVDLDCFKQVNDRWGHLAGDQVLREVARRLSSSLRAGDILVRYGGDEFVALVQAVYESVEYEPVIERFQNALQPPIELADTEVVVSATFGAAVAGEAGMTALELIDAADRAMLRAKRAANSVSRID
jgi:diguanylate cyclase (GGDEF)-like protein